MRSCKHSPQLPPSRAPGPAPARHVTRPRRPRPSARPRCSPIGRPALFTLYGQVLTLCGRPLAMAWPHSLDVIRDRKMQINRGILGIGVRGSPGTGSARSWRPHLEAEISGRTHEILRGKVGAPRGGHPEAPEPARLAGLFGAIPSQTFLGSTVCLAKRQTGKGPTSRVGDVSLCSGRWGDRKAS